MVDQTVSDVLAILNDGALSVDQRRARIEAVALDRFDFRTMARLVLARDWRRLDAAQQEEFVEAFQTHLSSSYGGRIERYEQESVEVLGERVEPRGDVTVTTRIVGGEADGVEVQYRLRGRDEPWRIIDVVIEGVSLVSSFRSQFSEVVSREGPQGLIQRLHEKNAAAAARAADPDEGGGAEAEATGDEGSREPAADHPASAA